MEREKTNHNYPPANIPTSPTRDRPIKTTENQKASVAEICLTFVSYLLLVVFFPLDLFFCIKILHEFQRAVVFRLGRLKKKNPVGPGVVFYLPCIESMDTVDLRVQSFDVPPQEVITKDAVTVMVDAIVYYRIVSPVDTIIQIADFDGSTQYIAQTTLRNVIGTKLLSELLTLKGELSKNIAMVLDEITDHWGIKVERVELRDITMPQHMQRAMALEQESYRLANAKVNSAIGDLNSVQSLKYAADVFEENKVALQLRYLQTLRTVSTMTNRSYILPLPIKTVRKCLGVSASAGIPSRPRNPLTDKSVTLNLFGNPLVPPEFDNYANPVIEDLDETKDRKVKINPEPNDDKIYNTSLLGNVKVPKEDTESHKKFQLEREKQYQRSHQLITGKNAQSNDAPSTSNKTNEDNEKMKAKLERSSLDSVDKMDNETLSKLLKQQTKKLMEHNEYHKNEFHSDCIFCLNERKNSRA